MRQKVTLSPTVSPSNTVKEESKTSDTNVGPKAQCVSCGSELAQRGTLCLECNGADSLITRVESKLYMFESLIISLSLQTAGRDGRATQLRNQKRDAQTQNVTHRALT